jgi:hypothetical protein
LFQAGKKAAETIKNAGAQPDLSFWAKKGIMKNMRMRANPQRGLL